MDWEQITTSLNLTRERLDTLVRLLKLMVVVVAVAYVGASSVSAYMMTGLLTKALSAFNQISGKKIATAQILPNSQVNYRDIEKSIKDRNLFNRDGDYPDEKDPAGSGADTNRATFDINAPCTKPTLNIELLGTIYLNGPDSVATLQEKGYGESDIYREGDLVIGNDQATVAKIERNRVIVNNKGVKECLELADAKPVQGASNGFPTQPGPDGKAPIQPPGEPPPASAGCDCNLDEKYVQEELGPGFGTIIQKARLVPNTTDNQMNGFKIFAIDQASLLGKTCLKNGDIITQVNETSLKQPEQGFALYQAFQDEKEVRIHILRGGTQPMMISCRIK